MNKHKFTLLVALLSLLMTGCTLSLYSNPAPLPTPTVLIVPTFTPQPPTPSPIVPTAVPVTPNQPTAISPTNTNQPLPVTQASPADFCADAQAKALINNLKSALQTSNGDLLASLVSPVHGMDVRLYRDGRVVPYDQTHAKFLFETTFEVDWGVSPGSGQHTIGSFHEVILPALLDVFSKNYTLGCNQVLVGGTTYQASWPYSGINFYSVYFPGTSANGNLDWHTWLIGIHYVNGKPYLYALINFQWEP